MSYTQCFLEILAADRQLHFIPVPLTFVARGLKDVFAKKNNKSLRETLAHSRYKSLAEKVSHQHFDAMDRPLGEYLAELKASGDDIYRRFLNPHGDKTYCHFRMGEVPAKRQKGLYLYTVNNEVVYIGRSLDAFGKRVDQGYGKIHPKNCFIDGQSTNCHINTLIEMQVEDVAFLVCPMVDDSEIKSLEQVLIQERKPRWNVAIDR